MVSRYGAPGNLGTYQGQQTGSNLQKLLVTMYGELYGPQHEIGPRAKTYNVDTALIATCWEDIGGGGSVYYFTLGELREVE